MITFVPYCDLFDIDADIYVNTVNCVGVMGKGIALRVKQKYPGVMYYYKRACQEGLLKPGRIVGYNPPDGKVIINIATKDHWRDPSQYGWVAQGLSNLAGCLQGYPGSKVVVPALGCGNGGLDWQRVQPLYNNALSELPNEIVVIEPPK